jgi:signal transduction histidine kinase
MEKLNILIVDDKVENIIALEALLQRNDIRLITTTSPNEALRICWEQEISIALVDVQMPEMDGFELVEIIKSNPRTRDILVIFVTAISTDSKYAVKGFNVGAVDYLYKPIDPFITTAKVESFIQMVRNQKDIKNKNLELEKFQKELINAKELAEQGKRIKENFLANMSHEIRTPINGIIGLVHLLRETGLTEGQEGLVNLLDISSQSLLGVINDILDISKIEAGKFKIVRSEVDIVRLTQSVIDILRFRADEKGIALDLQIAPDVPRFIIADSLRLNQILMNLISNGIKFTNKGSVSLILKVNEAKDDTAELQFTVKDTGIGIPESKLSRVFESFEQADDNTAKQYGGTGLGLSIVQKLAELKGGRLSVDSKEGEGSEFSFINWYQVVAGNASREIAKVKPSDLPKMQDVSILLAEDNLVNQFMIKKLLSGWDIKVDAVDDGSKVFPQMAAHSYDLIIMDTHMPVMGGYETTRKIREAEAGSKTHIPIISLSAAVLEEEQTAALEAGVDDVLSKPFDPIVLYEKIERLVKKGVMASDAI